MPMMATSHSGSESSSRMSAPTRSTMPLNSSSQEACGRAVKHQHQTAAEHVEGRARDGGLEEIGGDPGLDAFGLTGLHGFLDLAEMHMLRGKEHAADGVLVQGGHQLGHRALRDVDLLQHFDLRRVVRRSCS
jgi:hypothetical protein